MTINDSRSNISRPRRVRLSFREQKLKHLQADLMSTARMLAMDEVGAAMAHDFRAPLSALLSSLQMIEEGRKAGLSGPDALQKLIESAMLEAQRLRELTERMGRGHRAIVGVESGLARGADAIDRWIDSANEAGGDPAAEGPSGLGGRLTVREREVLALIADGASNKAGAHQLGISKRTFEGHRAHIMEKLGARNAADLGRLAQPELRDQ